MIIECLSNYETSLIVAVVFNLGSNIESESQFGYTHVVEHYFLNLIEENKHDCLVQAYTESDHMEVRFISKNNTFSELEKIFSLINYMINSPNFDNNILYKSKNDVIHEILTKKNHSKEMILKSIAGSLYHLPIGTLNSVQNISIHSFKNFLKKFLANNNFLLCVFGSISNQTVKSLAKRTIIHFPQKKQFNLEEYYYPVWNGYQHTLQKINKFQYIVIKDNWNVSKVYYKAIQMLGDYIIENIITKSKLFSKFKISYKYISQTLKIIIITMVYPCKNDHIIDLKFLFSYIHQHINDSIIDLAKSEITGWLQYTVQSGYNVKLLLDDRKRHFLYNEFSIYDKESTNILIKKINQLYFNDIERYFFNISQSPHVIFAD